jgi:hypothetical protein
LRGQIQATGYAGDPDFILLHCHALLYEIAEAWRMPLRSTGGFTRWG